MAVTFKHSRILTKDIVSSTLDVEKLIDTTIKVCGWIQTIRKQTPLAFIQLTDGSSQKTLQIVCSPDYTDISKYQNILDKGTKGVSIRVDGKLVKSDAMGQEYEIQADTIYIYGNVDASTYPISKKKHGLDYIRQFEHLRIRTQTISAVARIRDELAFSTHSYFRSIDCKYVHTPILTVNDCEGAGECFTVTSQYPETEKPTALYRRKELFKQPVSLTVSGQLHGETYAMGLGSIYTFGPTFRAENSNTSRHLCEFWMIEPELAFITVDELFDISEEYVQYCIKNVMEKCKDELEFLNKLDTELISRLTTIVENTFVRITYTEAVKILQECGHKFEEDVKWGIDFGSEHERYLTDIIYKGPVILTHYPKDIKSFYMKQSETDPRVVECMDVIVPGIGELIGGSMREDDYDKLDAIVKEKGIIGLDWYMDLRKYGSVPHGGFGLGFERLVLLATGMKNIRDVIPFPRFPKHCKY